MGQKTDTIDRQRTDTSGSSYGEKTDTPPSWSELSQKAETGEASKNILLLTGASFAFGLFLPLGTFTALFAVTLIASALGFGSAKSGAVAGGVVGGVSAFFGSILLSIFTLGIATIPTIIIGAIVGGLGGFIGKKIAS
jgi:hypothetical protein